VWLATREFLGGFAPTEHRVFAFAYRHDSKDCLDIVGRKDRYGMEEILVLLEGSPTFLCCTANRGVLRGEPILIGKSQWDGPQVVEFYPE
jgi:hypothetical protein